MQSFDQALYDLVKSNKLAVPEALAHATNPADLKMRFDGIAMS